MLVIVLVLVIVPFRWGVQKLAIVATGPACLFCQRDAPFTGNDQRSSTRTITSTIPRAETLN